MKIETKNRINLIVWLAVSIALSAMIAYYWIKFDCNVFTLFLDLAFNGCFPLLGYVLVAVCIREHEEENIYKGRL